MAVAQWRIGLRPPPRHRVASRHRATSGARQDAASAGGRQWSSPLEPGATYLRRVRTTDGSVAELGGIAYSETRPIAVINGSVVSNGDFIAGFTVIAVEPERVELEADGVRIFLALR